jgi:NAD(P)-dependent dehydrogenase (short-subunit alcohol dehydrogenase family)
LRPLAADHQLQQSILWRDPHQEMPYSLCKTWSERNSGWLRADSARVRDDGVTDMTALGRVGLPDDIGPMIASLLSEDNRWVNAQRIEASGGMSI